MKRISPALFNQLKERSNHLVLGWYVQRRDGFRLGFTSGDVPFTLDGLRYNPSNAFSGMAVTSKSNLSVDNTSAVALISEDITRWDLQAGLWDNAVVRMFWVDPINPRGTVPIRGGHIGEIKIRNGDFEAELRSPFQKLQQPFGDFYTLECSATLGDFRCKVWLDAETWLPGERYIAKAGADAGIGSYVKPRVQNGYWYQCVRAQGQQGSVTSDPAGSLAQYLVNNADVQAYVNASGAAGQIKIVAVIQKIKDGTLVVDETSHAGLRAIGTLVSQAGKGLVSEEGALPFGESYYQQDVNSAGQLVNSLAFLTPTKEGKAPKSAPAGVQPLTITNLSSSVRYALGLSGNVEPAWPTTLGDEITDNHLVWRCIRARRLRGSVVSVFSRSHFADTSRAEPAGWWRYGTIEWLTGENKGITIEVRDYGHANGTGGFALLEAMPGNIVAGDEYEVVKGCAKTRTACKELDNIHNYRGFPDMPTEEKALATANIVAKGGQKKQDSGGS